VDGVLLAEGAILVQLKLVRGVLLVLHGIVVSLLALTASQSDLHSHLTAPPYYWHRARSSEWMPIASLHGFKSPRRRGQKRKMRTTTKPFFTGKTDCTTSQSAGQHLFSNIFRNFFNPFPPLAPLFFL
jgi:hypothetical protein